MYMTADKIKKFSKPSADILRINLDFLENNDKWLKHNLQLAKIYRQQPKRERCKICSTLLDERLFTKQRIDYFYCSNCNHLNGGYEDTEEFNRSVYTSSEFDYSSYYRTTPDGYIERVQRIYVPKGKFLIDCLKKINEKPKKLSYCDIGAGSGYFVYALKELGLNNVIGNEISKPQIELANRMLDGQYVVQHQIEELPQIIKNCESEVVSLIGVLEHLQNPSELLNLISNNKKIKYVFLQLPMFSLDVFFEFLYQKYFNRHLFGGHTHLFTKESISYFSKEHGFEIVGEWYFGQELLDLHRLFNLKLDELKSTAKFKKMFNERFVPLIDDLQSVIDKTEFCSDLHLLLRKTQ